MKVLYVAYEAAPIYKVGGLGDVAGSLPKALSKLGVDLRLVLPKYKGITPLRFLPNSRVPVFYIKNPGYFETADYSDVPVSVERRRFAFFCQAILESLPAWNFWPDIIHINDWHTSLIPLLLKSVYKKDKRYHKIATVLTIHNLAYQGISPLSILEEINLAPQKIKALSWDAQNFDIDILMQGIIFADVVNTVSPTYASEIMTQQYGFGLDEVLKGKEARVFGILNGIDYEEFNPATDKNLTTNYDIKKQGKILGWEEGKRLNKQKLCEILDFKFLTRPLLGIITRLVEQKGTDLILETIPSLLKLSSIVILGKGQRLYEEKLEELKKRYKEHLSVNIRFDEKLARLIYAGSDLFLMPSLFEPCGLVQLIAMRYGTVPIVRETGGLKDTVDEKTGFVFRKYSSQALTSAVERAVKAWWNRESWRRKVERVMRQDFSWSKSAQNYCTLYKKALEYRRGS